MDPRPKFRVGDKVERDDGSMRGTVSYVGQYDSYIGGYRYKVQEESGSRIYWNETSMRRREKGRGRKISLLTAKAEARETLPLHEDYFALSRDDRDRLGALMRRTTWRQSKGGAAMGRSRAYSFWLALSKAR